MLNKNLVILLFVLVTHVYAENCPTIQDIKNHDLKGWQAYTLDNGTLPSQEQINFFNKNIDHFALAEWMDDAPEGSGHCYYEKEISDQNYLGIFLAKQNLIPKINSDAWINQGHYTKHCLVSINACEFMEE